MHFITSVGYSVILYPIQVVQRYKDDKYFSCTFPIFEKVTNLFDATGHHVCSLTLPKSPLICFYQN